MGDSWKYFVVELTYLIPFEQFGDATPAHRAFLQAGYDQGWVLLSGPQTPRKGGIIITRAPSRAALEEFFTNDPFNQRKLATYRFIEFDPVKRQPYIEDWAAG